MLETRAKRDDDWVIADVFVSYSRRDAAFVEELRAFLAAAGRDVWVDTEEIPPGAKWEQELDDSIDAAQSFVFVASPDSLSRASAATTCG